MLYQRSFNAIMSLFAIIHKYNYDKMSYFNIFNILNYDKNDSVIFRNTYLTVGLTY